MSTTSAMSAVTATEPITAPDPATAPGPAPATTGRIAAPGSTDPANPADRGTRARRHPVRRAALTSGTVAAVAVTAAAAAAHAAGVPFELEGEMIPLAGFAQMTVLGAVLGGLMAAGLNRWSARPRHLFVLATTVLTVLSCVPSVAFPQDVATRVALVATHVLAAAIIVPVLARRTTETGRPRH